MYSPALMSYFHNSTGTLEEPDASAEAKFPRCGDSLRLDLKIQDDHIVTARFQGYACGAVVAAAALGTELLTGATLEQAQQLNSFQFDEKLGALPAVKRHAYLMFFDCLHQALQQYFNSSSSKQERTMP